MKVLLDECAPKQLKTFLAAQASNLFSRDDLHEAGRLQGLKPDVICTLTARLRFAKVVP